MSALNNFCRFAICVMVIVILGMLIGDLGGRCKDETATTSPVSSEAKPVEQPPALAVSTVYEYPGRNDNSYRRQLKRFEVFRSKVLLKDAEVSEKERLLAHMKTIHWIESQLCLPPARGKDALGDRLTMIDFLEEALAWRENPVRNDVLDSVERALKVNNLQSGSKEVRQMLAGDKIELFAILAEHEPDRAKALLEKTSDKQLTGIFQYAVKRLALQKLSEESR